MKKNQAFMLFFLIISNKIKNALTEVQNPLDKNQVKQLTEYRDKTANKIGYFEQQYLDLIIQDENPSWLCSEVKTQNKKKNFYFNHYFNIFMDEQYELYYSRINEYNVKQKKYKTFSKFLKIENFESGNTTKVLRELNYNFQMSKNIYLLQLNKCYYEQRKANEKHIKKYPELKIGDDIGERIYLILDQFDLNLQEYLTTIRINQKDLNSIELQQIELIKNIAIGVRELHKQNLVHSNLSLQNIGLKKRENKNGYIPKIYNLDWTTQENELEYSEEIGKSIFKAPEFIKGESHNSKSIDVFALGIIFYALMSKQHINQFVYSDNDYLDKKILMQSQKMSKHKELTALFIWMTQEDPNNRPNIVQVKLELINYRNCFQEYINKLKKSKRATKNCDFKYKNKWKQFLDKKNNENELQEQDLNKMKSEEIKFLQQYLIDSDMNTNRKPSQKEDNILQQPNYLSLDQLMKLKIFQPFQKQEQSQYQEKWPKNVENQKKQRLQTLKNIKHYIKNKLQNEDLQESSESEQQKLKRRILLKI